MGKIKVYFGGCSGIKEPKDYFGRIIKEGYVLTHDWFSKPQEDVISWLKEECYRKETTSELTKYIHEPTYIVRKNKQGGYYAEGLNSNSYLHDFRFKYTKLLSKNK